MLVLFPLFASAKSEQDPWESFNRKIFGFNEVLDKAIMKPVAKGYQWITPKPVDKGISNFFSNLGEVKNIPNSLLQLKFKNAGTSSLRLIVNSTVGIGGIFDVASRMGLNRHKEDLGQTLGHWGVKSGPYMMLPILGPSNVRDSITMFGDSFVQSKLSPLNLVELEDWQSWSLTAIKYIDVRADLLAVESMLTGDKYVAMRELTIQLREYDVRDGDVPDAFINNDDDDDDYYEFIDEEDLGF
ncbi:MAG: VacJ family lipoprotein [Saccharospirillaceae bacterium]|nr:VacJ family lipoprotein [Pseudomonadales bacterium]NRB78630.1 VacJ family lipoprotein [Saccharospirillaceae bacterium]